MEYFTSPEQELSFRVRYQKRWEDEQDRLRSLIHRQQATARIQEEDRIFFVEPDGIYLGEVHPSTRCPPTQQVGGWSYGVDPIFIREVLDFTRRHSQYVVIFHMCRDYSRRAGIFPARMVADGEELVLEDRDDCE